MARSERIERKLNMQTGDINELIRHIKVGKDVKRRQWTNFSINQSKTQMLKNQYRGFT